MINCLLPKAHFTIAIFTGTALFSCNNPVTVHYNEQGDTSKIVFAYSGQVDSSYEYRNNQLALKKAYAGGYLKELIYFDENKRITSVVLLDSAATPVRRKNYEYYPSGQISYIRTVDFPGDITSTGKYDLSAKPVFELITFKENNIKYSVDIEYRNEKPIETTLYLDTEGLLSYKYSDSGELTVSWNDTLPAVVTPDIKKLIDRAKTNTAKGDQANVILELAGRLKKNL